MSSIHCVQRCSHARAAGKYLGRTPVLVLTLLCSAWLAPAGAAETSPWAVLEAVKATMIESLQAPDVRADPDKLNALVERVLLPHVDMRVASQLVLGKHWKPMAAAKRAEFKSEFENYLLRFYTQALAAYVQSREIPADFMSIEPEQPLGDQNIITIQSQILQPRGEPVPLAYRLRRHNGWRVIDISLSGISMAQLYRAQFAAVIERDGIDGLIAELRAQNAALSGKG